MTAPALDYTALLRAIVQSSDDAIVSKDLNGIVTSWNPAAERMFGYTAEEMLGRSIRAIIPADRQDEEDRVLASVRRGEKFEHFETVRQSKSGELVPVSLTVSPVYNDQGTLIGASKIARDIRERRRAEAAADAEKRRDAFLARVMASLTGSLDYERTLRTIAEIAVPDIADWCAVDVLAADGSISRVAHAHVDPAKVDAMERVHTEFGDPTAPTSPGTVIATGKPALLTDISEGMVRGAAGSDQARADFLLSIGFSSYMCVPMIAGGRCVGAITFTCTASGRHFDEHDLLFAQEVAARAALAVGNARSYEEVRAANRLKDEFLATLSHEMRTPLNAVLGYARMLRNGVTAPERRDQAVEVIERNAVALAQIVEDVLDVSRIISGKTRLEMRAVALRALIEESIETVLPAAEAKGVRIEADLDGAVAPVSGDPDRLRQVAWNLLSNAVKFTPRGERVSVRLESTPTDVSIVVSDTGIGIAREFLPHMFERFRQWEAGPTRQHGGLGLGLAIARHIVEMHGGSISAASEGLGRGATFRVQLPAMGAHVAASRPVDPRVSAPSTPGASSSTRLEGFRVLAVDDDPDARALIQTILEDAGAAVISVPSAADAMNRLLADRPTVIVADIGMPGEDGYGLIERVRRLPDAALRSTPAVALTAYTRPEERARSLRFGFNTHIAKPVDPARLVDAVASLAGRGAEQA